MGGGPIAHLGDLADRLESSFQHPPSSRGRSDRGGPSHAPGSHLTVWRGIPGDTPERCPLLKRAMHATELPIFTGLRLTRQLWQRKCTPWFREAMGEESTLVRR